MKVLVIDDEPAIVRFVVWAAERAGFEAEGTASAQEFQKSYEAEEPAIIVMDLIMPDMDGIELMNWLSSRGCSSSIILLSGYDGRYMDTAHRLMTDMGRLNVAETIRKPTDAANIEAALIKSAANQKSTRSMCANFK